MTHIREAATVMVVRDAPDLHVFMLQRNLRSDFVGGASVFPGGAVDESDRSPEMLARCRGRDDEEASALLGLGSGGLGFWVAAIRETFEEAGVLFARDRVSGEPVDGSREDLDGIRRAIGRREHELVRFLEAEDLVLDVGALFPFAHWITPLGMPRRYDTWFFVATAPEGHGYLHDDTETVASTWTRPREALEAADREELTIIFPTRRNLEAIGRFERAAALIEVAETAGSIDAIQPRIVADGNGARLLLPGDPGYDTAPEHADGPPVSADSLRHDGSV